MLKKFFLESKNISSSSYFWNMIGSMIMAFQSVILLVIITRIMNLEEAGIFTIAYANASLFLTIGKYGMRYYQVSDTQKKYSFGEYRISRMISTLGMLFVSVMYTLWAYFSINYSFYKCCIILLMCVFKIPDAIEDVYYGEYQRCGRLDIASKIMTIRMLLTLLLFSFLLILIRNLAVSLMLSIVFTIIFLVYSLKITSSKFEIDRSVELRKVLHLIKENTPLCIGAFLALYIGNAPKYSIDLLLNDESQACYGFIAMPVFVIGLLNGFIFNPMIYKISRFWNENLIGNFVKSILKQIVIVFGITVICILGAYICGIPILSVLYNTDLSEYKIELLILLLGGGFLGLSGVLNTCITIMRKQKYLLFSYSLIALLAFIFSDGAVSKRGVYGASLVYCNLMIGLSICFSLIVLFSIMKEKLLSKNKD